MAKWLWIFVVGILMTGFVVGMVDYDYKERVVSTKYYPREDYSVTITKTVNYHNPDRYSTYDYRHGYSYRTTKDFWREHRDWDNDWEHEGGWKRYHGHKRNWKKNKYDNWNKGYYYKWSGSSGGYRRVDCYHEVPEGKLFYIKCV